MCVRALSQPPPSCGQDGGVYPPWPYEGPLHLRVHHRLRIRHFSLQSSIFLWFARRKQSKSHERQGGLGGRKPALSQAHSTQLGGLVIESYLSKHDNPFWGCTRVAAARSLTKPIRECRWRFKKIPMMTMTAHSSAIRPCLGLSKNFDGSRGESMERIGSSVDKKFLNFELQDLLQGLVPNF